MFITSDLDILNTHVDLEYLQEVHEKRGLEYVCEDGKIAKVNLPCKCD